MDPVLNKDITQLALYRCNLHSLFGKRVPLLRDLFASLNFPSPQADPFLSYC